MPKKVVWTHQKKPMVLLTCSLCGACGEGEGWIEERKPLCPNCAGKTMAKVREARS